MNLNEKIIKDLSKSLNKDPEVTERVCNSIFEFFTQVMREEKYEPYRIQGLGTFEVKPYIKKKSEKAKKRREEREQKNRELYNNLGSGNTTKSYECEDGGMDTQEQKDNIL